MKGSYPDLLNSRCINSFNDASLKLNFFDRVYQVLNFDLIMVLAIIKRVNPESFNRSRP